MTATLPNIRDVRARLQAGTVRGLFVGTHDATLCEFVAMLGWDFLLVDAEHSAVSALDMEDIARACALRGACPMARVPATAPAELGRFLDAGAIGVMVPFVETSADAIRAVELIKYPPRGRRGLAAPRSADFGAMAPLKEEIARANRDTVVIVQIESLRGLDQVEEIAAVTGVDVVFVGPTDLSLALGAPFEWDAPIFEAAIARVASAAVGAHKVFGAYAGSRERMQWYEERGARFLVTALEDLILVGSHEFTR
jgi:2-keto-3-deoxy-L-rhamnonate aldolase RhmA